MVLHLYAYKMFGSTSFHPTYKKMTKALFLKRKLFSGLDIFVLWCFRDLNNSKDAAN